MTSRIFIAAVIGVGIYGIIITREVFLLGFFAIVLSILMSFPVNLFGKFTSRGISVLLTLLLMIGTVIGLTVLAVPIVTKQTELLKGQIPVATQKLRKWIIRAEESTSPLKKSSSEKPERSNHSEGGVVVATELAKKAIPIAFNFFEAVSAAILVFVLAAFLAYDPRQYRDGIRTLIPESAEKAYDDIWDRLTIGLKHWVGGIFIEMLLMGIFAGLGLWIVGVDGALTLGLLTFIATFVPYLGAITSSIPGLLMGLAKSPSHLLYAGGVYLGVHILEGYILSPFIMKRAIRLRPGLLLFWEALMGTLFGILGIIVATPFLACVKVIVGYLYIEKTLGKPGPKI